MLRFVRIALLIGACATPAMAQVGQFPGVAPPVPSPQGSTQLGGAPLPPAVAPGPNLPSGFSGSSRIVTTRRGRNVVVPDGPANRNSFSDRVERCVHAGSAAGLSPNANAAFTGQCAN
jgi:hypothetical protein